MTFESDGYANYELTNGLARSTRHSKRGGTSFSGWPDGGCLEYCEGERVIDGSLAANDGVPSDLVVVMLPVSEFDMCVQETLEYVERTDVV